MRAYTCFCQYLLELNYLFNWFYSFLQPFLIGNNSFSTIKAASRICSLDCIKITEKTVYKQLSICI